MRFEEVERGRKVEKKDYKQRETPLRVELLNAQTDLLGEGHDVQILIAGDDREGCEEVIDLLHEWLDARRIDTEVFGQRSVEESRFPFFWRYWRSHPARGRTAVYLGHWVYDLMRLRFTKSGTKEEFTRRLREVRGYERTLADGGTVLRKFWIHTPRKELGRRLKKKKKKGKRAWRVAERDRVIHEHYEELVELAELVVSETDSHHAPWIVVEGTDERYRNLKVAEAVQDALTAGKFIPVERPQAPEPVRFSSRLDSVDLSAELPRDEYKERLDAAQTRLADLTLEAAERGQASVVVFEGWDAAGKGGSIRRMTRAMTARDYRVIPIAAPTEEERAHHYLWRFWRRLPRAGRMVIFDRSWYGRVLVERIEGFARSEEWQRAYREIADFERMLVQDGILLRKFWLEIDRDEQMARFEARKQTPYKRYKMTKEDYRNRDKWDAYAGAVDEMIARTHTTDAPWKVVAANDKPHARVTILEEVCEAFEKELGSSA